MSTGPHHPTNPLDPPETDWPPPEPTNPTVGCGLPPTEHEPFGLVGGFPPPKPEPPDPTTKSTTSGDIRRISNKKWLIPAIFLLFRLRSTWNSSDPMRSDNISSTSSLDLTDLTKYRLDLAGPGKILAPTEKLETDWHKPENPVSVLILTHPRNSGRFRVRHNPDPDDPWTLLLTGSVNSAQNPLFFNKTQECMFSVHSNAHFYSFKLSNDYYTLLKLSVNSYK